MIAKAIEISDQASTLNALFLTNVLKNVLDGRSAEDAVTAAQQHVLESAPSSVFTTGSRCVPPEDVPEMTKEVIASSRAAHDTGHKLSAILREGLVKAVEAGALKVAPPSVAQVLRQYR